jgi:hypothetical protein
MDYAALARDYGWAGAIGAGVLYLIVLLILGRSVSFPEISEQTSVVVHPSYRRALGVRD